MKRYCFDTSGISNPLEAMPEDIHQSMWGGFKTKCLESAIIAVTQEIYAEMEHIPGTVGQCIRDNKANLIMEVGEDWDWALTSIIAIRWKTNITILFRSLLEAQRRQLA
jgi:hypothetical protein